jgi:hypothetical protein
MSAHTPGPWVAVVGHGSGGTPLRLWKATRAADFIRIQADSTFAPAGQRVAVVPADYVRPDGQSEGVSTEAMANAALMSAAPLMLDALRTTLGNLRGLKGNAFRDFDTLDEWIRCVEDAVVAAEGSR